MSEPSGARNISQSLFMMDEKLMADPQHLSQKLMASKDVSGWNSISGPQGIDNQTPAYLNQSRLSTYYQDNPWPTLQFSNRFGLSTMGGPVPFSDSWTQTRKCIEIWTICSVRIRNGKTRS